ncbi:MAG: hypothetical protein AB9869_32225 [Verrucomicrobiia bacterium]
MNGRRQAQVNSEAYLSDKTAILIRGSLHSRDRAVAVGNADANGFLSEASSCQLPVGEYLPAYLSVQLGKFRIAISQNYHCDGGGAISFAEPRRTKGHSGVRLKRTRS